MRTVLTGLVAAAVVALIAPVPAHAAWSAPRTFDAARHDGARLAVNGRGDAVVLWASRSPARLRVTSLPARGRRVTRVLSRHTTSFQTVALDERGGATAAWNAGGGLYAVHGSVAGRWSAPQLIARRPALLPTLAVSPDRRVLLAWTNDPGTGAAGSTGIAWGRPRHRFSGRTTLRRPAPGLMPGELPQSDVGATFDTRGRAYLWGTCDGVVRMARPHSRRLKLVRVAPGRALGFSLAVTETGRGLASWADSTCVSDPEAPGSPGPVLVRALQSGTFGPPRTLTTGPQQPTPLSSRGTHAIALAGDGNLVTVATPSLLVASLDAQGTLIGVTPVTDHQVPLVADAGGNLILPAPYVGFVVRPRGGADEPFDKGSTSPGAAPISGSAAVAVNGLGFGIVWDPDVTIGPDNRAVSPGKRLSVSLWSP